MTFLPVIDESACLAHGDCAELAPEVFVLEDVARVIGTASAERARRGREILPRVGDQRGRRARADEQAVPVSDPRAA